MSKIRILIAKNKHVVLLIIFLAASLFRFWLADKGWHVDMWSNAAWGEWIYEHGPAKFYENSIWAYSWPTQLPVINSTYAFNKQMYIEILGRSAGLEYQLNKILPGSSVPWLTNWVAWFGYGKVNIEIPFQIGYLVTMKLLPILADMVIASVIYYVGKRKLLWPGIYLVSPFTWYLSAGWGQYDGMGFALALLSFLSIFSTLGFLGPALITLAILVKPTSLILLPFFGYLYLRQKNQSGAVKILGLILPLLIFWVTTQPYTHKNPFEFARYDLTRIVFEKSEPRLTVNSFNLWRVFIGNAGERDNIRWLSLVIFGILNVIGAYIWEKNQGTRAALWKSLFVVSMGSFLFMTGMLERYAFAGIVFGLLTVTNKPHLLKYWLAMSVIFWINLYYHWWWPEWLFPLKSILSWNQDFVTRILSGLQVILFAKLILENFRRLPPRPAGMQKNSA